MVKKKYIYILPTLFSTYAILRTIAIIMDANVKAFPHAILAADVQIYPNLSFKKLMVFIISFSFVHTKIWRIEKVPHKTVCVSIVSDEGSIARNDIMRCISISNRCLFILKICPYIIYLKQV